MSFERTRSLWWVILPVFLEIIGGVIAYFVLRRDDYKLAKFCLQLGIVLTIIQVIAFLIIFSTIDELSQEFGVNI